MQQFLGNITKKLIRQGDPGNFFKGKVRFVENPLHEMSSKDTAKNVKQMRDTITELQSLIL